jgi:DNA-binding FadR family transcriptional regulator
VTTDDALGYPRERLHGRLVRELGLRIVSGALAPGEPLPTEESLVGELSSSRSAVREAIKVLAGKGLVVTRTRVGTTVQDETRWNLMDPDILAWRYQGDPTSDQLDDLAGFRVALEPEAARLAALAKDRRAVTRIRESYERMAAALNDTDVFIARDLEFHRAVVEVGGNQLLIHLNQVMSVALAAARQVHTRDLRRNRRTLPAHLAVLEAIEARDPDQAAALMRALVRSAQHDVRRARHPLDAVS